MPAGVSTFTYLKFATAAFFSMALGSQCVHMYYRPLEDLEQLVNKSEEQILPSHVKALLKEQQQKK